MYEIHFEGDPDQFENTLKTLGVFTQIERMSYYKLLSVDLMDNNCSNPEPEVNDPWIRFDWANKHHLLLTQAYCTWTLTHGNPSIIVGVADTEFDVDHEDLVNKFAYTSGTPGIYSDSCRHGTAVSGLIAAQTNNSIGIASLGYNTRVAGYYVTVSSYCTGNPFNQVWQAYQDGLRIVNLSWTSIGNPPYGFPLTVVQAVQEMTQNGVSLVCAAGNTPGSICHSAYANIPGVINVSGINYQNYYAPTGHAHNQWVDICALSDNVTTTKPDNQYGGAWGTSFAAPQVCATIALMLSVNPNLTPPEIEEIIKKTADPIADQGLFPGHLGAGKLNAYYAVLNARQTSYKIPFYSTGFDQGFDTYWKIYQSNNNGRTMTTTYGNPKTGIGHLTMDVIYNGTYSINEGWLHLNLYNKNNVIMRFWWKEFDDESHSYDGIYFSSNAGQNFTKVYNLTGGSSVWQEVSLNISDLISQYGLSHSSNFVIKFQQYDNYTMPTDGIAIDDILICVPPVKPDYITGPYQHCIFEWEEYTCAAVPNAIDYEWDFTGKYLSGSGRTVEVMDTHEGWYTLKVRAINVCGQLSDWKTKSIYIENCWRMMDGETQVFQVIPNPANEYIEIIIDEDNLGQEGYSKGVEFQIELLNALGYVVYEVKTKETNYRINIRELPSGIYTVLLIIENKIYSRQVVIEH